MHEKVFLKDGVHYFVKMDMAATDTCTNIAIGSINNSRQRILHVFSVINMDNSRIKKECELWLKTNKKTLSIAR